MRVLGEYVITGLEDYHELECCSYVSIRKYSETVGGICDKRVGGLP